MSNNEDIRLNKFLSTAGVASRRKCDELIFENKIKVNGIINNNPATRINPNKDSVVYNDKEIKLISDKITIAINKSIDIVCSKKKYGNEKTIYDLLPPNLQDLNYAGRLDKNSEGLLILSNDGDLINYLIHPRYKIEKEYYAKCKKAISDSDIKSLINGVELEEGLAFADKIKRVDNNTVNIVLKQGWKRQIRRMIEKIDNEVSYLKRFRIGNLFLNDIPKDKYITLTNENIKEYFFYE